MKVRQMPYFVSSLLLTLTLAINSCSSSQQQQQQEAVAGQQQGQEENYENQQQGEEFANQQGEEFNNQENLENQEGFENQENFANQENMDDQQQYAENQEMNNQEGMGDELAQAEEEGDLEDIVEEMNQTAGVEEAPIEAEPAPQTVDNPAANPAGTEMADAGMGDGMADGMAGDMTAQTEASNNLSAGNAAEGGMSAPMGGGDAMATTAATDGLPEMGAKMSYIVQKGDTLGKIADKIYGDMSRWRELAAFTGVSNPSLIYPGDLIYYQLDETSVAFARTYENLSRSEVVVAPGDTLAKIATRVLGDSQNWRAIWRQNDNINDPDKLVAGEVLFYISAEALATLNTGLAGSETPFARIEPVHDTVKVTEDTSVQPLTATEDQTSLKPVLPITDIDQLMI